MLVNIENFFKNKVKYLRMASLVLKLINYSNNQAYEFRKDLEDTLINTQDTLFTLPSGMCGNALALALELGYYDGALLMIIDAKKFGIDLDECAFDYSDGMCYSAKELFEHVASLDEELADDIDTSFTKDSSNAKDIIKKVLV